MRAARLERLPSESMAVGEVPAPVPGPGELLMGVHCSGICGTDLEILAGRSYAPALPFILGHEPVGEIVAAGPGADAGMVGRRVAVSIFRGRDETCGTCADHPDWRTPCRTGDERLCIGGARINGVLEEEGAFAEFMTLAERQAVPVPDVLSSEEAASLVDAGATAANAVRNSPTGDPRPAVVVGGGPLGFFAAQLLVARGETVVTCEPNEGRRRAISGLGIEAAAGLEDLDLIAGTVVDCSGAPTTLPLGLELLGPRGTFVVAGYSPVEADMAPVARKELSIRGVRSGRKEDLEEVIRRLGLGEIAAPEISSWPLEEIDLAFDALRRGNVAGKAVIDVRERKSQ